jgi:hypothetical protein
VSPCHMAVVVKQRSIDAPVPHSTSAVVAVRRQEAIEGQRGTFEVRFVLMINASWRAQSRPDVWQGVLPVIEIVFSVCTIVEGAMCRELPPIPLKQEATMMHCFMASQIEGAKWAVGHPNYYIHRATCRKAGAYTNI